MALDQLNMRQIKFVNAYLENDGNAVKSYAAAYDVKGYTTLGSEGHRLLKITKIREAIARRKEELVEASNIRMENKRLMLWDIAEDGMQKVEFSQATGDDQEQLHTNMVDSRASIAAISELNRMDGHHTVAGSGDLPVIMFSQDFGTPTEPDEPLTMTLEY